MENKVVGIQYLRGFAALAVVFCHYGSTLSNFHVLSSIFFQGQLGVHVFFLISGFVIVHSLVKNGYRLRYFFPFLIKRFLRIDPPYIIMIIATFIGLNILVLVPSFKGNSIPFVPGQFLAHLLYIVPFTKWPFYDHVFWTLGVEFQFYLIIGLLYFYNENTSYRVGFLLIFMLSSIIPLKLRYYVIFTYAPIFATGIAMNHYLFSKDKIYLMVIFAGLTFSYFNFGLICVLLLIISLLVIKFVNAHIRLFFFLGKISYSLYLVHGLLAIYLNGILKRILTDQIEVELPILFIKVLLAIALANLFYKVIERPSMKLSKRIIYKRPFKSDICKSS